MTASHPSSAGASVLGLLTAASLIALPAISVPTPALSEDMPASGDYRITFTGLNPAPAKPLTIGPNTVVSVGNTIMTARNETGGKLLHNMTGRCTNMPIIDNQAKTLENQGYCDYVDADGDHVFEKWSYPSQPLAAVAQGTGEWIGGTGKFAGITGHIVIKSQRVTPLAEGVVQFVGEKTGTYSFQRKTAASD